MPSASLIKGYLPVRLRLSENITYVYVKEHQDRHAKSDDGNHDDDKQQSLGDQKNTLFVANCPVFPKVRTKLLLQSIFGRFGDVKRATVVPNPRKQNDAVVVGSTSAHRSNRCVDHLWTTRIEATPSYFWHDKSAGKFAHVVFSSSKQMKRTLKTLSEIMGSENEDDAVVVLDSIELQTLADESDRQLRLENELTNTDENDGNDKEEEEEFPRSGLMACVARYRASLRQYQNNREILEEECNRVMQQYEEAEVERQRQVTAASSQPDDDGFITVSYGTANKGDLESSNFPQDTGGNAAGGGRGGGRQRRGRQSETSGRKRKKKKVTELTDFYRFQTKESRKQHLHELRQKFEEDLAKVQKMKEEKQFRT
jgi:ribosomal RNA-processing protein 7